MAALCAAGMACADPRGRIDVVDGDTLRVNGTVVRLFGIDAPEQDQTCTDSTGAAWACGAWVTQQVRARFEGRRARCDTQDIDRYGRVVARCWVGGEDLGRALVRDGLAFAYRRYSMLYDFEEKGAAIQARGLHGSSVTAPSAFRAARTRGRLPPDPACPIKGNLSNSGRIYHMPGQRDYDRTGINQSKGERWFCSKAEAEAAGWRAARR